MKRLPPLPRTIRVGHFDYALKRWPRKRAEAAGRFGECCNDSLVIRLATHYPKLQIADTLLHETLHAALHVAGIGLDEATEEKTVTALAHALCGIWRDNPDLIQWLDAAIKESQP